MRKVLAGACFGWVFAYSAAATVTVGQICIVLAAGAVIYFVRGQM